jgi:hypothetical protein
MPYRPQGVPDERPGLEQVPPPNRASWRIERAGWAGIALLLILALLGLFGPGPISSATSSSGPVSLSYQRFVRVSAPAALQLRVAPELSQAGELRTALDQNYLNAIQMEAIVPVPKRATAQANAVEYVFETQPGAPVTILFHYKFRAPGLQTGKLAVGNSTLEFKQFVYP